MAVAPVLKYLTVPAAAKHTATVIFVHGLGDTGHGWKPVADMFKEDPALAHVKWLLPHSPIRPVTANMGIEMPSWFDIISFGFDSAEDEQGMRESAGKINELIKYEIEANGVDPSRIVLGGFSQGGTMTLLTGLTGEQRLAGLVVLSGWLPLRHKFKEMASQNAASTPIFWGSGSADPLVKFSFVKDSVDFVINELGVPLAKPSQFGGLSFNVYEGMGHTTIPRELDELKAFIKTAIPSN
ncbi:Phospholipase/carboxylesterase [Pholiota conissans]|uniref:Acyl-protein thioesterase 1 n=1 Tax=Pholiota conissans TaxID=109636 RepID=A0A9P6D084_9AGAR|nr:Phospholipase/carboxylesterase [Pholiota conissans]